MLEKYGDRSTFICKFDSVTAKINNDLLEADFITQNFLDVRCTLFIYKYFALNLFLLCQVAQTTQTVLSHFLQIEEAFVELEGPLVMLCVIKQVRYSSLNHAT